MRYPRNCERCAGYDPAMKLCKTQALALNTPEARAQKAKGCQFYDTPSIRRKRACEARVSPFGEETAENEEESDIMFRVTEGSPILVSDPPPALPDDALALAGDDILESLRARLYAEADRKIDRIRDILEGDKVAEARKILREADDE